MKRLSALLIVVGLVVGMIGCQPVPAVQYELTISSSEGGSVTTPGEGTFTYDEGRTVNLVAVPASGYSFGGWTGDVSTVANVNAASTKITMNGDYSITANFQAIPPARYSLTIYSSAGGSVTSPGEGTYTYEAGTVVDLVAEPDDGYGFTEWTGSVGVITDVSAASTTITMNGYCTITANFVREIRDWYDLDAIRDNLGGSYVLMNDLDSTIPGYEELAAATANGGKGWEPIGGIFIDPFGGGVGGSADPFVGSLDGQGYEIRELFLERPDEDGVALFSSVGNGVIDSLAVVNAEVTGHICVGGLVGSTLWGSTVSNCHFSGRVTGHQWVGGLAGGNWGIVSNSYSTGDVASEGSAGGLVGANWRTVSNSHSTGSVTGAGSVGGLVGWNHLGTVSNSYSSGDVASQGSAGGLVGEHHDGTVSNSYYNYDEVLINGRNTITIGALSNEDFEQWLANGKFLDVGERLSQENGYYLINDVNDFKSLLAFGQDASLKFRLTNDLNLSDDPDLYIPYLAGEFDGNGQKIQNLNLHFDCVRGVGLFGYLASGGAIIAVGVENVNITGNSYVGGVVGENDGGIVRDSYSTGSVTGEREVGGLVGENHEGTVSNSYYSYDEVLINGRKIITIGALSNEDFEQWLANGKFLDVSERLSQEDGCYLIGDVDDFKSLLAFGQDAALRFRLTNDLDLGDDPDFYIPYLAGEFDGNGHKIRNLSLHVDFAAQVGLFGYLGSHGRVSEVGVENVTVTGPRQVGGLVGGSSGTVSGCYSSGSVVGGSQVGGLLGWNGGAVSNSYSDCRVTGEAEIGGLVGSSLWGSTVSDSYSTGSVTGEWNVGGLVGWNGGTLSNCYSGGSVTGDGRVGGLAGENDEGTLSKCFWDMETSGQATSAGGTGKTTAEMRRIATFSGAGWKIVAVADPSARNLSYIWNMVDGQTYPFLSWQPVS